MSTTTFDELASGYDAVADSSLGLELRARVHGVLFDRIAPGDRVVDLGCGSGIDAAWLSPQVADVRAFDPAAQMVARTRRRCADLANVRVAQADAATLELAEPADIVLANFGVVNCLGDLTNVGTRIASMLRPGGDAVLVTMTRWCPIELAIGVVSRNRGLLTRRRSDGSGDYAGMALSYASAGDLARAFEGQLELTHAESLGLILPPFEQRRWVQDRTRLRRALAAADQRIAGAGGRIGLGDHHIAVFRKPA